MLVAAVGCLGASGSLFSLRRFIRHGMVRAGNSEVELGLFLAAPVACTRSGVDRDLEGIRKKIDSEKKDLSQLKAKEGSVLQSLGKIESDLKSARKSQNRHAKLTPLGREVENKEPRPTTAAARSPQRQDVLQTRSSAVSLAARRQSVDVFNGAVSLQLIDRTQTLPSSRFHSTKTCSRKCRRKANSKRSCARAGGQTG